MIAACLHSRYLCPIYGIQVRVRVKDAIFDKVMEQAYPDLPVEVRATRRTTRHTTVAMRRQDDPSRGHTLMTHAEVAIPIGLASSGNKISDGG